MTHIPARGRRRAPSRPPPRPYRPSTTARADRAPLATSRNAGLSAIASSTIALRSAAALTSRSSLCGGCARGRTATRSRPSGSRDSSAIARCPQWIGSNVPPRIADRPVDDRSVTRAPSHGSGSHSSSSPPIRTVSPGADARPAQLGVDAEAPEVALEACGRFLVVEVGLGGDPLDPAALDPEGVALARHGERVPDATRSDARRRPTARAAASLGVGQQLADRVATRQGPRPSQPTRPGRRVAVRRMRAREVRPGSRAAGRSSLLKTTRIGFSSSAGSCSPPARPGSRRGPSRDRRDEPSTTWTRTRVRSTWRRNACPRPAPAGALDQPGHVRDRRPPLVLVTEVHDPEVRLQGRERIVARSWAGPR